MTTVTSMVGVYDADGGIKGEAAYVFGKMLGSTHCALCDVTHGLAWRKPTWDLMVMNLGMPIELVHRNEIPDDVAEVVAGQRLSCVVVRLDDGSVHTLLGADELEGLGGSVDAFDAAARAAIAERGWSLVG